MRGLHIALPAKSTLIAVNRSAESALHLFELYIDKSTLQNWQRSHVLADAFLGGLETQLHCARIEWHEVCVTGIQARL